MSADQQLIYITAYMRVFEQDGPIADDVGILARRTALTARRVTLALDWLSAHRFIDRLPDCRIDVPSTREVLADRRRRSDETSAAATGAAKKRWQKDQRKQQNGDAHFTDSSLRSESRDSSLRSESREASAPPQPLAGEAVVIPLPKISDHILALVADRWNGVAELHGLPPVLRLTGQRAALCRRGIGHLMELTVTADPLEAFDLLLDKVTDSFWVRGEPKIPLELDRLMRGETLSRMMAGAFRWNERASRQEDWTGERSFLPTPASGGFFQIRGTA